jgi:hypothetical protein
MSTEVVTGVFTLLGAVIGAIAALVPGIYLALRQEAVAKKSIAYQLYAEIAAVLRIETRRGYLQSVERMVEHMQANPGVRHSYMVSVQDVPFRVYNTNLSAIGHLPPDLQRDIVRLYQWMESIVQDIKPGGVANSEPAGLEVYWELLTMLREARTLAEQVLDRLEEEFPGLVGAR